MMMVPTELRTSSIHGIGAFLLAPVNKGELVWCFDSRIDRIYSEGEIKSLPTLTQKFISTYGVWSAEHRLWMVDGDYGRHFNHADQPSTVIVNMDFFADIVAARDLKIGEELTNDYRTICDDWQKLDYIKERSV